MPYFPKLIRISTITAIAFFIFYHSISTASAQPARINDCPTLISSVTPIDIIFVLDDSGSMSIGTRRTDAITAAKGAVDTLFSISPTSRIGLAFMNKTGNNLALSSDAATIKSRIDTLTASGGTPTVPTINTAATMLPLGDAKKDVIMYFSDGGFSTSGLGADALSVTRAGVAFDSGASFSNIVALAGPPGITGDANFAREAPTGAELLAMFNEILVVVTTGGGDINSIDADGDGNWPSFCAGVSGTLCGKINPQIGSLVICTDTYDSPADFGLDPLSLESSTGRTWIDIFQDTSADLDGDGNLFAPARTPAGFPVPSTGGKDWYDHPFTSDLWNLSMKPTLSQLADTINDLDLDGYASQSWADLFGSNEPTEPDSADVFVSSGNNTGGCFFPTALEETCFDCQALIPNPATGRIARVSDTDGDAATPVPLADPKKVCQIEAYYEKNKNADPPYTLILSGTVDSAEVLLSASAQCRDNRDNNLNGLADDKELSCPQEGGGLVPCGRFRDDFTTIEVETNPCGFCHFFILFKRVIDWIMFAIAPVMALLFIVLGGFLILSSRGNQSQLDQGKQFIIWALIGFALILIAWLIINSLMAILDLQDWTGLKVGEWWKIKC